MTDENTFLITLKAVAEIARVSEKEMSDDEMLSYFSEMELNDEQKLMVLNYLKNPPAEEEKPEEGDEVEDGESKAYSYYLEEMGELPEIDEEELGKLYKKFLSGEDVSSQIVTAWLKRVDMIASGYSDNGASTLDLVQEGNLALILKLEEMKAENGNLSYEDIDEMLRNAIEKGIADFASSVSAENEIESSVIGKLTLVKEAEKAMEKDLGRKPSKDELANYTGMEVDEIETLFDMLK